MAERSERMLDLWIEKATLVAIGGVLANSLGPRPVSPHIRNYVQYCLEFSIDLLSGYYRPLLWPLESTVTRFLDPLDEIKLKLPEKDKAAFKRACFVTDTTMARELRRFVRWYIRHHAPGPETPRLGPPLDLDT